MATATKTPTPYTEAPNVKALAAALAKAEAAQAAQLAAMTSRRQALAARVATHGQTAGSAPRQTLMEQVTALVAAGDDAAVRDWALSEVAAERTDEMLEWAHGAAVREARERLDLAKQESGLVVAEQMLPRVKELLAELARVKQLEADAVDALAAYQREVARLTGHRRGFYVPEQYLFSHASGELLRKWAAKALEFARKK